MLMTWTQSADDKFEGVMQTKLPTRSSGLIIFIVFFI